VIENHVGARARRRHAYLQAFQILWRPVIARLALGDSNCDLRCAPLLHETLQELAFRLHVQGVLVGARYDVGASAYHRAQGLRPSRKVADLQVQAFVLEIAQLLGDRHRQVVERRLPAHRDVDVFFLKHPLGAGECRGQGDEERHKCDIKK
jgi:hypothetical protein